MDDTVDDFLDSLPAHKRKKVMGILFSEEQVKESTEPFVQPVVRPLPPINRPVIEWNQPPKDRTRLNPFKVVLALALGVPLALMGVLCMLTIILAPVGFLLLGAAGYPLSRVMRKHLERNRDD